MPKTTITFDAWKCLRCDYVWKGKTNEKPLRCANPNCGSVYWDRPRTNKTKEGDIDAN